MAPATNALELYRDWILLLFRGEHHTQKLTEIEIAATLRRARCHTSVSEVRAALQRWGEVSTTSDDAGTRGSGSMSPPPEHEYPSTSHTPLYRPAGVSPFLGDGLLAFIDLYGVPKGVPLSRDLLEELEERQQQKLANQRIETWVGSNEDSYTPPVVESLVARRQALLAAGPMPVDPNQCNSNLMDVDVDREPAENPSYDPEGSPFYLLTGARKEVFAPKSPRVRKSQKWSSKNNRRGTSAPPQISASNASQTTQTPPTEQIGRLENEHESVVDAAQFHEPASGSTINFETQIWQRRGSNYSSRKRMRTFSTSADDDDEGGSKRFRGTIWKSIE